ncbi:MAG: hypothetical protein WCK51_07565 [Armatimonadota bacterium]
MTRAERPIAVSLLATFLFGCRQLPPPANSPPPPPASEQLSESQLTTLTKNWNCIYTFKDRVYFGKPADHAKGIFIEEAELADTFAFSTDGTKLAYWRLDASGKMPNGPDAHRHSLIIKDLKTSDATTVTKEQGTADTPGEQLSFSYDGKYLAYAYGNKLQIVPLSGAWKYTYQGRAVTGFPEAVNFAPDGKHIAFSRDGDVFQGQDLRIDNLQEDRKGAVFQPFDANRIAPLAEFFDSEGGSSSTPTYAKQVYWLPGSNSLLAVVARQGGSGWRCVALLKRPKDEDAPYQGTGPVNYGWEAKWVTPREEMTFNTSICPDQKHWTSQHAGRLHFYDLEGNEVGSLPAIDVITGDQIIAWAPK